MNNKSGKIQIEGIVVFILILISVLQVDAFLVIKGFMAVPAFVFSFFTFLLSIYFWIKSKHRNQQAIIIKREFIFLFFLLLLLYFFQLPGLFSRSIANSKLEILFFWSYTLVLIATGLMWGEYLGSRVHGVSSTILLVLSVLLILDYSILPFSSSGSSRAIATLRNPNTAAFVLVLLFILALSEPIHELKRREMILFIISSAGMAVTWSIGGIVTFIMVIFILLILWLVEPKKRGVYFLIPVFLLFLFSSVGYLLSSKLGVDLVEITFKEIITFRNVESRMNAAANALQLFQDKPLFGHGLSYVYALDVGPHNMFLRLLVEGGVFGLIGMIISSTGLIWYLLKIKSARLSLYFFALILISMSTHNLLENRSILVLTGIVISSSSLYRSNNQLAKNENTTHNS